MLIVDSGRGCFYQRCFDADCRAARFSSNEFPLPAALIRAVLEAAAPSGTSALDDASSSDLSIRDTDEEWSQETLASIDEFLQQRGLVTMEQEQWDDQLLAVIDQFLTDRASNMPDAVDKDESNVKEDDQEEEGREQMEREEEEQEEWDEAILTGIDDFLRERDVAMRRAQAPCQAAPVACMAMCEAASSLSVALTEDSGDTLAFVADVQAAAAVGDADLGREAVEEVMEDNTTEEDAWSFDNECIRALENVEHDLEMQGSSAQGSNVNLHV